MQHLSVQNQKTLHVLLKEYEEQLPKCLLQCRLGFGLAETFWEVARSLAVHIDNRIPLTREPMDNSKWESLNDAYNQFATHSSLKQLTIPFCSQVIASIDKEKRLGKKHNSHGEQFVHGFRGGLHTRYPV